MNNRGIIKWLPFNSILGQKELIAKLEKEKKKIKKPILSFDQQLEIEEKIIEAFYEQILVTLKIYKNGFIYTYTSSILQIDTIYKKITLKNGQKIFFNQIISIML